MALLRQAFHEIYDRILHAAMVDDVLFPLRQCRFCRKATEEQQVGCFEKRRAAAQFFDPDAAILEDAAFTVHITDCGFCSRDSCEPRHEIVRHSWPPTPYCALLACTVARE